MTAQKNKIRPWQISRVTGAFIDPQTEEQYLQNEFRTIATRVRTLADILGLLFLSFVIPDWFAIGPGTPFILISALRVAAFAFLVVMGRLLDKNSSVARFVRMVTAAKLVCVAVFTATVALYPHADFLIQAFGLMLLLAVFYLIPNRFLNQVAVSLLAIAAFLSVAAYTMPQVSTMHMLAGTTYLVLISVASAATFARTSYHKRRQFLHNLRLHRLATTDALTRIDNRHKFNEELRREINRYRRTRVPFAVVLMDLDDFKAINDRFGHLQGDRVLVQFAQAVRQEVRVIDVFARWGGEEFALLLPATTCAQAEVLAQRLLRVVNGLRVQGAALRAPARTESIPVACCFGIAHMHAEDTIETVIQRADRMLYQAKATGRNCIATEQAM